MHHLVLAVVAAMLAVIVGAAPVVSPWLGPSPVFASSCPFDLPEAKAVHDVFPGKDGGRATWAARTLNATDWANLGFASQVVWVSTDNDTADSTWVEVGTTKGFAGQNIYTLYTARAINYHNDPGSFDIARWTSPAPVLGHLYRMTGVSYGMDYYSVKWNDLTAGTTAQMFWLGHNADTAEMVVGLETTCGTSRVDRTYVTSPQFRTTGTSTWTPVTSGVLDWDTQHNYIAWCTYPTSYRYYQNPQNDPSICG